MPHYLCLIRAGRNAMGCLSPEGTQNHVEKVGKFIQSMYASGRMKAAQPLEMNGVLLAGSQGKFQETQLGRAPEGVAGYYLMEADDLEEAVSLAKADPRFDDNGWTMEIRPVMKVEGIS